MNAQHHLDEATLVSYCAGALPTGLAVIAAAHLQLCRTCRARWAQAERVGGLLMAGQAAPASSALVEMDAVMAKVLPPVAQAESAEAAHRRQRDAMLARLDMAPTAERATALPDFTDDDLLPVSLHPYFGQRYSQLAWRWLIPGVRMIRAQGAGEGSLVMFNITPGTSMPVHSHGRSELTQVLKGAYRDALGQFGPGDIADLDETIEHQPVAWGDTPCICVAATDAPLRFSGLVPRLMQPFIGL